jgi:hypothetical protein
MLGAIFSRPASAWRRVTLTSLTRALRTPRVLDERIRLKGYENVLRSVTVTDLGHEEPTIQPKTIFHAFSIAWHAAFSIGS